MKRSREHLKSGNKCGFKAKHNELGSRVLAVICVGDDKWWSRLQSGGKQVIDGVAKSCGISKISDNCDSFNVLFVLIMRVISCFICVIVY